MIKKANNMHAYLLISSLKACISSLASPIWRSAAKTMEKCCKNNVIDMGLQNTWHFDERILPFYCIPLRWGHSRSIFGWEMYAFIALTLWNFSQDAALGPSYLISTHTSPSTSTRQMEQQYCVAMQADLRSCQSMNIVYINFQRGPYHRY